jgi:molybdopterin-guanine dinucleotide biosynthesis protein A
MKYDIMVLGGGEAPKGLEQYSDYGTKATLKMGDKLMIEPVVDALAGARGANRLLVVGAANPLEKLLGDKVWKILPPGNAMFETLRVGLDTFADSEFIMVATCDIPLISADMVSRFADAAERSGGDICYSVIEKATFDRTYPTTKRTYGKMKDGVFTGGNLVILRPEVLLRNWDRIEEVIAARKSPIKLAKQIGFWFIILLVLRQLRIAAVEDKIESIIGAKMKAVKVEDAEIGIDVDKVVDYELVMDVLSGK